MKSLRGLASFVWITFGMTRIPLVRWEPWKRRRVKTFWSTRPCPVPCFLQIICHLSSSCTSYRWHHLNDLFGKPKMCWERLRSVLEKATGRQSRIECSTEHVSFHWMTHRIAPHRIKKCTERDESASNRENVSEMSDSAAFNIPYGCG